MGFKKEITRLILLFRKDTECVQQFLLLCTTGHELKTKECNSTTVQVSAGNISEWLGFSLSSWINIHYNQVNSLILSQYKILLIQEKYLKVQTVFSDSLMFQYMSGLKVQYSWGIWVIRKAENSENSIWHVCKNKIDGAPGGLDISV